MVDKSNSLRIFINIALICANFSLLLLPDNTSSLKIIGYYILLLSIVILFRYKDNQNISLLVGIILMVSLSLSNSICFNLDDTAFYWQKSLTGTSSNIITMKNYSLFITFFCLFLGKIDETKLKINYRDNSLYFILLFILLLLIFAFGFDKGTVGTYVVNRNPLYEYGNIIFVYAWIFTNNNTNKKNLLLLYAVAFCIQALLFGSRTSAFPMILFLIIVYSKNIKLPYVLIMGLVGILFGNFIDIFRNVGFDFYSIIKKLVSTGFFVNTITYSHYAGVQIINYSMIKSDRVEYLANYVVTTFFGNSDGVNLSYLARNAGIVNQGGGFSHTYFYYLGGYIGTVLISIILARVINKIFNTKHELAYILRITIIIYSLRWIIYYPFTLTRTSIFIPILIYFLVDKFNIYIRKR